MLKDEYKFQQKAFLRGEGVFALVPNRIVNSKESKSIT